MYDIVFAMKNLSIYPDIQHGLDQVGYITTPRLNCVIVNLFVTSEYRTGVALLCL